MPKNVIFGHEETVPTEETAPTEETVPTGEITHKMPFVGLRRLWPLIGCCFSVLPNPLRATTGLQVCFRNSRRAEPYSDLDNDVFVPF